MDRKGMPVVLTATLLVVITVVLGAIFLFWVRGMTGTTVMLQGKNIQLVCNDVVFEASYSDETIYISNYGNVPIYGRNMIAYEEGSHETKDLKNEEGCDWPKDGLAAGGIFSGHIEISENTEKLILVPVLRGESSEGAESYTCDKNFGYEVWLG